MRVGLVQLNVNDDPAANLPETVAMVRKAAAGGAQFVLTPECTNGLSSSRRHQAQVFHLEGDDPTLAALRTEAADLGVWLLIGSLALLTGDADGRFANRSFLIDPQGEIAARYDKVHMFDVNVSATESYRESEGYRPGDRAVMAQTPLGAIGMSICYDVRFAYLYRRLAQGGAQIITVPAAFNDTTGAAHWEVLLRARAIETGCFVLAPAQTGYHPETAGGKGRRTWGHSLVIAPWGEVLADAGTEPGVCLADIDLAQVEKARSRVPSLTHDRQISGPDDQEGGHV
ncbi:carbon-nitrogen hydrolase family protein [Pseudorhodobacter turbinis]|uniref:Carbon-nitrogen hydrolase family protein n=1 Tax=Pseudorhodobacter turbinis TaxID=2500533 RepID=A0A4P8EHC1_9RHOB|nr:carbon-nitrogen hydrolase family protein [Pseudorhodobacter turbinis]QCO56551.1 carbon-nitrogen hydrolase family protein [Pseudorhodobacter turbinis]